MFSVTIILTLTIMFIDLIFKSSILDKINITYWLGGDST